MPLDTPPNEVGTVSADAPPVDTQMTPAQGQPQAPAQDAPQQPMQLQASAPAPEPPPGTFFKTFFHSAAGAMLGALAGPQAPTSYTTDESGKMTPVMAPTDSTGDKLRRIARSALSGLAAGSQVQARKSGAADAAAGLGAGFQAQKEAAVGDDQLKRAQAKESFEQQQKAMLTHMEIAKQNGLTSAIYFENIKRENELSPEFARNEGLIAAAKASPALSNLVHEMSDEQVAQKVQEDPAFLATHVVKPLGWAVANDPTTGQPIIDPKTNAPKQYMRLGVLDGTKGGDITITPELAADFAKYGPLARIPNAKDIKAGDQIPFEKVLPLMNAIEGERKNVLDGWQKSELAYDPDGKPVEINKYLPPDDPGRVRPLTVKPLTMAAQEGKTAEEKAQGNLANAKAKEALANAALISSQINNTPNPSAMLPDYMTAIQALPQSSQVILRNVPPKEQMSLLTVANGDADMSKIFPTRTTKGSGQLDASRATNLVKLINPEWTEGVYKAKQDMLKSYGDPSKDTGKAIASFNQFFVHAGDLLDASTALQRSNSPWLNEPLNKIRTNGMGQPGVGALMTDIQNVRHEWQNFINAGHAVDLKDSDAGRAIMSDASNPMQILSAAREMGLSAIGRLDQIDSGWTSRWGGHYPNLISNTGRAGATKLGLGDNLKQYKTSNAAFGGVVAPGETRGAGNVPPLANQAPNAPAGATGIAPGSDGKMYYHDIKGNILGEAKGVQ